MHVFPDRMRAFALLMCWSRKRQFPVYRVVCCTTARRRVHGAESAQSSGENVPSRKSADHNVILVFIITTNTYVVVVQTAFYGGATALGFHQQAEKTLCDYIIIRILLFYCAPSMFGNELRKTETIYSVTVSLLKVTNGQTNT